MLPETAASICDADPVLKRRADEARRRAVVHTRNSRAKKLAAEPPAETPRRNPGDIYGSLFPASGPRTEFVSLPPHDIGLTFQDMASRFQGGGSNQYADAAVSLRGPFRRNLHPSSRPAMPKVKSMVDARRVSIHLSSGV
jgi:hypothetical protein